MTSDNFFIKTQANAMYMDELRKTLGINPHSEQDRKRFQNYLTSQRRYDEFFALGRLRENNPGKTFSYSEILTEAEKIRIERLVPYIEKIKMEQKLNEEFKESEPHINNNKKNIKEMQEFIEEKQLEIEKPKKLELKRKIFPFIKK